MKSLLFVLALFLFTSSSSAQLVRYSITGSTRIFGNANDYTIRLSGGAAVVDLEARVALAVTWWNESGRKYYSVEPFINMVIAPVRSRNSTNYTAIMTGRMDEGIFGTGSYHKGQNTTMKVSNTQTIVFPKVFNGITRTVDYVPGSASYAVEGESKLTFDQAKTIAANNAGQSLTEHIEAQVVALRAQGYQPR
jgi:hypothetical protein